MTDIFRKAYRPLNPDEANRLERLKDLAERLHMVMTESPKSREQSLALTKLEEAVMWAVKGLTA